MKAPGLPNDAPEMAGELLARLAKSGYHGRMVSIERLPALQEGIEGSRRRGLFDEAFYQDRLAGFKWGAPDDLPEARSVILAAAPHPRTRFTFTQQAGPVSASVPPTYLHAEQVDGGIQGLVAETLAADGYRAAPARLPVKLLAVRSGLARYGKNNITYVEGLGSFYRLAAFYTDLPCPGDAWQEPQMLDACQTCQACRKACPTGAIDAERFLLHGERCLTYLNEKPGDVPFPAWVDARWHNCLVGCLHCQTSCPQNRSVRDRVEAGATFSQAETELLLQGVRQEELPPATLQKLEAWDLLGLLDVLPRNLGALVGARMG
jgi:epoxyqueuosine reductase